MFGIKYKLKQSLNHYKVVKMKRIIPFIIVLLLTACTQSIEQKQPEIGVIGIFSGSYAYYGQEERRGVELAVEELTVPVKLIFED